MKSDHEKFNRALDEQDRVMTRYAQEIGAAAWKILPPEAGHIVIVFDRKTGLGSFHAMMTPNRVAVDAGCNPPGIAPALFRIIWRADVGGLWWLSKAILFAWWWTIGMKLGIYKRGQV